MKLKKEHICTALTIVYHCMFLGGASFYVTEFQKTRDTIVQQVDRVEKKSEELITRAEKIKTTVGSVKTDLKKVERACSKIRF